MEGEICVCLSRERELSGDDVLRGRHACRSDNDPSSTKSECVVWKKILNLTLTRSLSLIRVAFTSEWRVTCDKNIDRKEQDSVQWRREAILGHWESIPIEWHIQNIALKEYTHLQWNLTETLRSLDGTSLQRWISIQQERQKKGFPLHLQLTFFQTRR